MEVEIRSCRIGDRGQSIGRMTPSGAVDVDGTTYSARAKVGSIDVHQEVVVVGYDLGGLLVEVYDQAKQYDQLPNFGQPAFDSFGDRTNAQTVEQEKERQVLLEIRHRRATRRRWIFAAMFASITVYLVYPLFVSRELVGPTLVAAGIGAAVLGGLWAMGLFTWLDRFFNRFDEDFSKLTIAATGLGLLGTSLGLYAMRSIGVAQGGFLAVAATLVCAALLPIVGMLVLSDPQGE